MMAFTRVIGESYNEGIFALIHKTWYKTQKQITMPEEMLLKEIDHECNTCKKFWHVLPGHEICSQTNSIKAGNFTYKKLEMWSSRLCKNCWKCPSLLLHVHSSFSWPLKHSFTMQSPWAFNTQPPHLFCCYIYPYALMWEIMFKE